MVGKAFLGTRDVLLSELKKDVPNLNFGVTFLPGAKEGEVVVREDW